MPIKMPKKETKQQAEAKTSSKPSLSSKRVKTIVMRSCLIVVLAALIACCGYGIKIVADVISDTSDFNINSLISKSASVMCAYDEDTDTWVDFMYVGTENTGTRNNVTYDDLPQVLIDAVVATEDSRFYTHNGIDIPRIIRALIGNVQNGEITSGGSTITQQLIKNAYYLNLDRDVSQWERKIGEIYLALKVETKVSKDDILVNYLNMIQFGNSLSTLGVQAACQYYFDKDVQDITLPEAALLAGVINQPSKYDPYYNLEGATERRDEVLDLMVRHGYITEEEAAAVKAIPVENYLKKQTSTSTTTEYTSYLSYYDNVITELDELGIDPYEDSIRIYTNMDFDLQEYVEDIGSGSLFTWSNSVLETSITLIETHTGKVLCTLSGREYVGVQNPYTSTTTRTNRTRERHQPGSSLKPIITYSAAFEFLDWSTGQYISNDTYYYYGNAIRNWDGNSGGTISLTEALRLSYNNPAMYTTEEVADEIGTDAYVEYLESFGFDMSDENFDIQYAIGGWDHGVSTLQTAAAYGALSNEGTYIDAHFIYKIEYLDGSKEDVNVTEEAETSEVLSAASSFMIREVMQSYSKTRYEGLNINYNVCAKSGTTNYDDALCEEYGLEQYSAKDSLMNAFTEDYAVSVWVGYDTSGVYIAMTETEKTYAGIIAGALLSEAHGGVTTNSWSTPSDVVQTTMIAGISDPYVKPTSSTPSSMIITAWFKENNVPVDMEIDSSLSTLSSFTASYDESSNAISVTFSKYSASGSTSESAAAQIYGDVIYVVEVYDTYTGALLDTITSDSNSFTLDYSPSGSVTLVGYYARENAQSIRSNEITTEVSIAASGSISIEQSAFSIGEGDNSDVLGSIGATVIYNGEDVTNDASVSGTIDFTTAGTYNITITYRSISQSFIITVVNDESSGNNENSNHGNNHQDEEDHDE